MIRWPDEQRLSASSHTLLEHFRATSAAAQLEADDATWELEASSWLDDFPERLIWRSEKNREAQFVREDDSMWRLTMMPMEPVMPQPNDPLTPLGRAW